MDSKGGQQQMPKGPPYLPQNWMLGGLPSKKVDIPITSVFLVLFVLGAVTHMTIFQLNRRKGHKFVMSAILFGFCMARTATCTLRISSLSLPTNTNLAIASQVFTAAGVILLYIINVVFAMRIVRAQHPHLGWHSAINAAFIGIIALVIISIAMLVTAVVQSFFTLRPDIRKIDRGIQLYGVSYFLFVSFLPLPILLISTLVLPRRIRVEKFGTGRFRTKIVVLATSSFLLCAGATYKAASSYKTPLPRTKPMPAYDHKAAFYIFNFGIEVIVLYLYAFVRIDRRFHVPDGAKGPGSYAAGYPAGRKAGKAGDEQRSGVFRVYSEEETFDNQPQEGQDHDTPVDNKDLEAGFTPMHKALGADSRPATGKDSATGEGAPTVNSTVSQSDTLRPDAEGSQEYVGK